MKNIAITGSFASGKTFVLNILKDMGYKIFSCDEYVRKLYQQSEIRHIILHQLPELKIFEKSGLARLIFSNTESRKRLESIIHPMVRAGIKEFELYNSSDKLLFTEVPLLFESRFDRYFYKTIAVYCSEGTRALRAKKRGVKNMAILKKIANIQLPQLAKIKLSDYSVNSDKDINKQLLKIIKLLEKDG